MVDLSKMICGPDGKVSTMRVSSFVVIFSVMGVFVYLNVMSGIRGTGLVNISWELMALLSSVLGVKAYQHKNENSTKEEIKEPVIKE